MRRTSCLCDQFVVEEVFEFFGVRNSPALLLSQLAVPEFPQHISSVVIFEMKKVGCVAVKVADHAYRLGSCEACEGVDLGYKGPNAFHGVALALQEVD